MKLGREDIGDAARPWEAAFDLYDAMKNPTSDLYESAAGRIKEFLGERVTVHLNLLRTEGGEPKAKGARYQRAVTLDLPSNVADAIRALFGAGSILHKLLKAALKKDSDSGLLVTSVTIQLA